MQTASEKSGSDAEASQSLNFAVLGWRTEKWVRANTHLQQHWPTKGGHPLEERKSRKVGRRSSTATDDQQERLRIGTYRTIKSRLRKERSKKKINKWANQVRYDCPPISFVGAGGRDLLQAHLRTMYSVRKCTLIVRSTYIYSGMCTEYMGTEQNVHHSGTLLSKAPPLLRCPCSLPCLPQQRHTSTKPSPRVEFA